MLVDHADAGGDGILAVADGHRTPGDADLAPIGQVEAEQDAHQGGLAGTVLADDPVNAPRRDLQAHVPVGVNGAETLVDPAQRHRWGAGAPRRAVRLLPRGHGVYFTGHSPSVT